MKSHVNYVRLNNMLSTEREMTFLGSVNFDDRHLQCDEKLVKRRETINCYHKQINAIRKDYVARLFQVFLRQKLHQKVNLTRFNVRDIELKLNGFKSTQRLMSGRGVYYVIKGRESR